GGDAARLHHRAATVVEWPTHHSQLRSLLLVSWCLQGPARRMAPLLSCLKTAACRVECWQAWITFMLDLGSGPVDKDRLHRSPMRASARGGRSCRAGCAAKES